MLLGVALVLPVAAAATAHPAASITLGAAGECSVAARPGRQPAVVHAVAQLQSAALHLYLAQSLLGWLWHTMLLLLLLLARVVCWNRC